MEQHLPIAELLRQLVAAGGSDLHLTAGAPPHLRIDGELQPLPGYAPLAPGQTRELVEPIFTPAQRERFARDQELDFSFGVDRLSRFRASVFTQRGSVGAVIRVIPSQSKSFEELGLPPLVKKLCRLPRGLILCTGPAGSGKSTTLAAMLDLINSERHGHITTVEDPIEFVHRHKGCLVNQREVYSDTPSFALALRSTVRQDPNVVLIGEMRDLESMQAALRIAETGHLTLTTLHTNTAVSALTRLVDAFSAAQQAQVRTQLSLTLEAVLCQALLPRSSGSGRVLALEMLVPNQAIRHLIREGRIQQIYAVMQTGQEKTGMRTMNQALAALVIRRLITPEVAMQQATDLKEFSELLARANFRAAAVA